MLIINLLLGGVNLKFKPVKIGINTYAFCHPCISYAA